jgi:hypothetical protein
MKRRAIAAIATALIVGGVATQTSALPGIDPANAPARFQIFVRDLRDRVIYERLDFSRSNGWDFGDRAAYSCAWVEYVSGGQVQFRVDFELVIGSEYRAGSLELNDKNGIEEHPDGRTPCGDGVGFGPNLRADGSAFVPGSGATFALAKGGLPLATLTLPAMSATNDESSWSVGNDPGEAYLWRVEPGEAPVPIVRATLTALASGVSLAS